MGGRFFMVDLAGRGPARRPASRFVVVLEVGVALQ